MAKLENWILHTRQYSNGTTSQYLTGNVFGHPKADWFRQDLIDGHRIFTSNIVNLDLDKGIAITQSGTVYELGVKEISK